MKKVCTLMCAVVLLCITTVASAQCPTIVQQSVQALPNGKWIVTVHVNNPSGHENSIQVICECFSFCRIVKHSGDYTFVVEDCPALSNVHVKVFKNNCCQGSACDEIVLPVKFISFDAKKNGKAIDLVWKIAAEGIEPNSSFTIERSYDAITFEPIATLPAVNTQTNYKYTDHPFPNGDDVYYRIKGDDSYTRTVNVYFKNDEISAQFRSDGTLYVRNAPSESMIEVWNFDGKRLKMSSSQTFSYTATSGTMYIVRVLDKGKLLYSNKLLFMK